MPNINSINPYTNEIISSHPTDQAKDIEYKLNQSQKSFNVWRKTSQKKRAEILMQIADQLLRLKHSLAEGITLEMGKPLTEAIAEIEKCAWVCKYYAENSDTIFERSPIRTESLKNYTVFEPLGVVLAIMPWNFPFWQVFRFLAPNLMAGNVAVLKHASNVQICAKEIFGIVDASFDVPLMQNLCISGTDAHHVILDPRIVAGTLTGSEAAGISVAQAAGKVMKKCVFELGGNDAFIVLNDADIKKAVAQGLTSRMLNSGQSCIAAKRFILEKGIADPFIDEFLNLTKALSIGDPMVASTNIGPLAKAEFVQKLHRQVEQSIAEGATLLYGGSFNGNNYTPTILTQLNQHSTTNREEFFGPVASMFIVENETEAIRLANQSNYGLSSSLWTVDLKKAETMARELNTGAVFINQFTKSDPRLPFGGIKLSGYGRELGESGLKEFCNLKTISIGV